MSQSCKFSFLIIFNFFSFAWMFCGFLFRLFSAQHGFSIMSTSTEKNEKHYYYANKQQFYVLLFISFRCISFSWIDVAFMLRFLLLLLHLCLVLVSSSLCVCGWIVFFSFVVFYFCFGIVFESLPSAHFTCGQPPQVLACVHLLHSVRLACALTTVSIVQNLLSLCINV